MNPNLPVTKSSDMLVNIQVWGHALRWPEDWESAFAEASQVTRHSRGRERPRAELALERVSLPFLH